jgi:CheY-like chemotaxis protein
VDDDALVSMNTADMLMDLGHSVLEAPSGSDALPLLETDARFDVVITGYAMPGMTGLDLAMKITQIQPEMTPEHGASAVLPREFAPRAGAASGII